MYHKMPFEVLSAPKDRATEATGAVKQEVHRLHDIDNAVIRQE